MRNIRIFHLFFICTFFACALSAKATAVNATWNAAADVPVTAGSYMATGNTVNFTLNFAPPTGTNLTVVNNTGLPFINGYFDNLAQGQAVALSYGGVTYNYVAHYYGGTGNDLVLVWAANRAFAWGANTYGAVGDGTTTARGVMVPVTATGVLAGKTIVALSQGYRHILALCSDGTLAAWGGNYFGQFGNGTTTDSSVPVPVYAGGMNGKTVVAISAGYLHSLALLSDGTVMSWGGGLYGALGNNSQFDNYTPAPVNTASGVSALYGKTVVAISAGIYYNLALCSDGTTVSWGYNYNGQLGNNSTTQSNVPVAVNTANGISALYNKSVVAVSVGSQSSFALCSDGTVTSWGGNLYGYLGDGTTTQRLVPVAVSTDAVTSALHGKTVVAIANGTDYCAALCSDGTIASWGNNYSGQLGTSSPSYSLVPVAINTTAGVSALSGKTPVAIAAAFLPGSTARALCSDGTLAAWGYGLSGELGNNTTTNSNAPVAVITTPLGSGERIVNPALGTNSAFAVALVAEPVPTVTTMAATALGGTSAVLNGRVNANNGSAVVSFDYGLTTAYGSSVTATPGSATGGAVTAVTAALTGLTPHTTYHFRTNASGGVGNDQTFTTLNNDASLASLTSSTGALSPGFASGTLSYTAPGVPTATASITLTPTLSDSQASVMINGGSASSGSPNVVSLSYGSNVFNVQVTAQDGVTKQTYAVTVDRALPATFAASYSSSNDVPLTTGGLSISGSSVNFTLSYAPVPGVNLTVVNNTGVPFISGTFANLAQGQSVALSYGGVIYNYVATYYGGTGNDLVLVWASNRAFGWGSNSSGRIGDSTSTQRKVMVPVTSTGVLAGKTIISLAQGNGHTLALCSDGTLASWGGNTFGQLGNNSTNNSNAPVLVNTTSGTSALYGKTVVAVAAGDSHSLAVCSDGTVAAWGYNAYGQLGDNTTTSRSVPVAVSTALSVSALYGKTVVTVSAGYSHTLALCSDGSMTAWGSNSASQLGDHTSVSRTAPTAVSTSAGVSALYGKAVVAVSAGSAHNMALCSDGTLVAWGYNTYGQLGNNSAGNSNVPIAVNTANGVSALFGKTVASVVACGGYTMTLCTDGSLAAWGDNSYGQLGDNTKTQRNVPVAVNTASGVSALYGKTVVGIAAGGFNNGTSTAFCADGSLAAWGDNTYGDLGNNSTTNSSVPLLVNTSPLVPGEVLTSPFKTSSAAATMAVVAEPLPGVTTLAAATITGTSAVLNGMVNTYGNIVNVSFDYGTTTAYGSSSTATPAAVSGNAPTAVSATLTGLLPLTTYHFRVNDGAFAGNDLTFTTSNNDASLSALAVGSGSLSPVFASDTLSYKIAVADTTASTTITPTSSDSLASIMVNGVGVTSGTASGSLNLGYGDNLFNVVVTAQDGTVRNYSLDVVRLPPSAIVASYGSDSDVPFTTNGLGAAGSTVNITLNYAPTTGANLMVVNNTGLSFINGAFDNLQHGQKVALTFGGVSYNFVASYFGGTGNDLVLLWADTRAFAWGMNLDGELGDGTTTQRQLMVPMTATSVLAGKTLVTMATGGAHSLALCSDGSVTAWGFNGYGQLGDATTTSHSAPKAVSSASGVSALYGKTVVAIASGRHHCLALCSDGTLVAWGLNDSGQLGDNTTTNRSVPVAVNTTNGVSALYGKAVVAVSAGAAHSMALCSDGSVVTWGRNVEGQLGNNTSTQSWVPVAVNTASGLLGKTVVAVTAGGYHNLALCSDGTVASWGYNAYGQLGNTSSVNSWVPVAVTATRFTLLYGKTVQSIAAGLYHSFALCSDGTLAAWGYNGYGNLGDASTTQRAAPVAVSKASGLSALFGKTVKTIGAGIYHGFALCSDGTMATWGANASGQLGNNGTASRSTPAAVTTSPMETGERVAGAFSGNYSYHNLIIAASPPPALNAVMPTSITSAGAVLNGTVNASNGAVSVTLEYGETATYGTTVSGTPVLVTGNGAVAVSAAVSGLKPLTTYHFRIGGSSYSSGDLTFTTLALSPLENWRQTWFGTAAGQGATADAADFDNDGIPNLIEWACHLDPTSRSTQPITTACNGANFEYTYSRSTAAANAGAAFTVEWSDSLTTGSWNSAGVVQTLLSDDGTTQQVKAVIPIGTSLLKFARLSVSAP